MSTDARTAELSEAIFVSSRQENYRRVSRLFAVLMPLQWMGGVLAAWQYWPSSVDGGLHIHVWTALILGGLLNGFPLWMLWRMPESAVTRNVVAVGQMLVSALLIHLTGGRIETHFHVFGSLAFLALYLDGPVLTLGALVLVAQHLVTGLYWPASVFNSSLPGVWRAMEHAGWVVFEVIVLLWGCRQSLSALRKSCLAQASYEVTNARIEATVEERTAQLQAAEVRFRSICSSVGVGVFESDAASHCLYANPATLAILGCNLEDVLGDGWNGFIHPEDHAKLADAAAHGFDAHVRMVRKDGEVRETRMQINPVFRLNATGGAAVGTIEDVTEQTLLERERIRAHDAAEAARRAKEEFLANVSHELRTPMHGIIGMTELVLATQLSSDQRDYIETAKSSAEGLIRVIDDVVDFSKMEAGQLVLQNAPFDLESTIQSTLQNLSFHVHEKDLELTSSVSPGTPARLNGDASRIRQLLGNLLENAVKFTESGQISLQVAAEEVGDGNAILHFSVSDTGVGIPEERQENIFSAFEQADNGPTRKYGGVGMGLAICSRLVAAMGGRIWVVSQPGSGSTFHFTARFGLPNASAAPRVLLVVDQPIDRRILTHALSQAAFDVTAVATQREALEQTAAADRAFDLIVTGDHAPSMDALELLRGLRLLPAAKVQIPALIICSGVLGDREEYRQLGVKMWTTTPLNPAEIAESAVKLVKHRPPPAPATRSGRILVAEDNPVNQKLACRLLEKQGYEVTVAVDGAAAIGLVEKQPFDLCLMDMHMPVVDGLEATAAIRRLEAAVQGPPRHMPIVAMTANAMASHRKICLAAGMDDYIAKPVGRDDLLRVLDRWLAVKEETAPVR